MLHIFRGGEVVSSNGKKLSFGKTRIEQIAKTYNRLRANKAHEAPIVKGHPTDDAPAYGWIDKLVARGLDLFAIPKQVDSAFAADVNMGKHKKISIALYQPDSDHNPAPGEYVLQHVGFVPVPAIKGLRDATFSGTSDTLILYFNENPMDSLQAFKDALAALFSSLGTEEMPVDEGLVSAVMDSLTSLMEPMIGTDETGDPTEADPQFSALTAANDKNLLLEKRLSKTIETTALSFCEDMLKTGKMTPAEKAEALHLLTLTANTLEFSGAKSALEIVMDSYRNRSPVIKFGEVSAPESTSFSGIEGVSFAEDSYDSSQLVTAARSLMGTKPGMSLDTAIELLCKAG